MYNNDAMSPLSEAERREFKRIIGQLERIRRELGWSQEHMAQCCRVSQGTYSRWVSGKSEPEPLALDGLKSRMPQLIAELQANRERIDQILKEIQDLRGGE